jgi:DNA helicase-2/ATP-dependent DNA helicase PcrA
MKKKLMLANSMDFDDLLLKTVDLLETNEEALNFWSSKFQFIMVDEYQDTNLVQYKLIELLSSKHKNLCVVGDSDQSIYAFRGADIRNIQEFEKRFY